MKKVKLRSVFIICLFLRGTCQGFSMSTQDDSLNSNTKLFILKLDSLTKGDRVVKFNLEASSYIAFKELVTVATQKEFIYLVRN